jgi:hypothetical protein
MEHVCAEVQNCPLIDFCSFVLRGVYLRIVFDKVADSLDEIAVFFLAFEKLLL